MKKGIILLSEGSSDLFAIIEENRKNEVAYVDYVIATSVKEDLLTIYNFHLGCTVYYVPNFVSVKKLVKQLKIDLVVFEGYASADISAADQNSLAYQKIRFFPLTKTSEKNGFYGKAKVKNISLFKSCIY